MGNITHYFHADSIRQLKAGIQRMTLKKINR
jgi:hypothetical protein